MDTTLPLANPNWQAVLSTGEIFMYSYNAAFFYYNEFVLVYRSKHIDPYCVSKLSNPVISLEDVKHVSKVPIFMQFRLF